MKRHLQGLRVILADDHAMVRLGFRMLLEGAGAEVVGEAETGEAAIRMAADLKPDLVIMDVSMPGMGGLAALARLLQWDGGIRVLMLSAHHDEVVPVRALRLGARGYLCKRATPETFLVAVAEVAANRRYLDPELAQQVALAQFNGGVSPVDSLTERELAVFLRLAAGKTVQAVADELCVSQSTVGTHLYHIKQKLNLQNSAEMTLMAVRNGLLEA